MFTIISDYFLQAVAVAIMYKIYKRKDRQMHDQSKKVRKRVRDEEGGSLKREKIQLCMVIMLVKTDYLHNL